MHESSKNWSQGFFGGQNGIVRSYKKCVCNENGDSSVYRSWQSTCPILTPICMSILAEVDSKCLWKENGIRKSRGVSVYSIEMRLHSLSSLTEQIFNSDFYVNHQTRRSDPVLTYIIETQFLPYLVITPNWICMLTK